jgi:hypothetical protein
MKAYGNSIREGFRHCQRISSYFVSSLGHLEAAQVHSIELYNVVALWAQACEERVPRERWKEMKWSIVFLLISVSVFAQVAHRDEVFEFDRTDREHCSVVVIEGRQMLQTEYGGTTVAVGFPVKTADGDFRVFVVVRQAGAGKTPVKPNKFFALYSDPEHSLFSFYDKAAEVHARAVLQERQEASNVTPGSGGDPRMQGLPRTPDAAAIMDQGRRRKKNDDLSGHRKDQEEVNGATGSGKSAGVAVSPDQLYLRSCTLHEGTYASGFVYFRKSKGSKLNIESPGQLFEVDVPVNGVVFRFR